MTDEEKEAIALFERKKQNAIDFYENELNEVFATVRITAIDILLNFIAKQQKEIEKLTAESTEWESKVYDLQDMIAKQNKMIDLMSEDISKKVKSLEQMKKELQYSSKDKIIEMFYNTGLKLCIIENKLKEDILNNNYRETECLEDKGRYYYAKEILEILEVENGK